MLEDLKKKMNQKMSEVQMGYAKEKAKQDALFKADPASPEAKAHARRGGLIFMGLGFVTLFINVLSWHFADSVLVFLLAANLTFFGLAFWMLLTGKSPFKKRP